MKKLRLYGLSLLTAASLNAEQVGNEFEVSNELDRLILSANYSRVASAKIPGSNSTEVATKVDSLFREALNCQTENVSSLSWRFDISGNKINLVGLPQSADSTTADTLYVLRDSVSVNPDAIPKQETQASFLGITGVRLGASYGTVSPEVGLVLGNGLRLVVSGSPYNLPSARDPKLVTTHTSPDPIFGTRYETTVDTAKVAKKMRNLSLGMILPEYKGLEATLGGGIHWEENAVKGNAETQKVDRNYVPLIHAESRKGPFHSSKSSTGPMINLGLDYKVSKNNAVGFYYQRILGNNGRNRAGLEYRRSH